MEIFSNKNIKFDAIKTKTSSQRALKDSFQKKQAFNLTALSATVSFFIQKNKEISLAIVIVLGTVLFLYNFIQSKTELIHRLDKQVLDYTAKEKPLMSWQKLEKVNKEILQNFPTAVSEALFLETISLLATQQGVLISQYTPVPLADEGFYQKMSLRLDCEAKSFQSLMMFFYEVEHSSLALRLEDIKISILSDANKQGLNIKLLISLIQLKENYDKSKKSS